MTIRLPGDKSISHRALILASLADGPCRLANLPGSADVAATRSAIEALGLEYRSTGGGSIVANAPASWNRVNRRIDCGNSGTTSRLLTGLLTGTGSPAILDGDDSLRRRPMDRVVYPLQSMGGRLSYLESRDRLPIQIDARTTGALRVLRYRGRIASAQVKSAILLAGLAGRTEVEVWEPQLSRDHTERMLEALGAPISTESMQAEGARVRLSSAVSEYRVPAFDFEIPGDISSGAFLLSAGLISGRSVRIDEVGLNPTRTGFLDILRRSGVEVRQEVSSHRLGEPVGSVELVPGPFSSFEVGAELIPFLLDEIPLLAVLAIRAEGVTRISGAEELRHKESDRLTSLVSNLRSLGVEVEESHDGLAISGTQNALAARVRAFGDHRIAMAFSVLGVDPKVQIAVDDPACAKVSYPGFAADLTRLLDGVEK